MTLANLQQAVAYLFPSSVYSVTWTANTSDSSNVVIALWNGTLGAQPTASQLAAALASSQLQTAQTAQTAILQTAYEGARYGTPLAIVIGTASVQFPTNAATQTNVMGYLTAYSAATSPATVPLQDATGSVQNLTYAELQSLAAAIADQSIAAWTKLQGLLASVQTATTVAAVGAVTW